MLKTRLLHPEILRALASAGHGARILIADGNYPCSTEAPPLATRVFLNLRPGLPAVLDVLEVLAETVPVESVLLMMPADGQDVPLHAAYRKVLPESVPYSSHRRLEFYAEAKSPATALVIATGEVQRFANVLLTVGVVRTEPATGARPGQGVG